MKLETMSQCAKISSSCCPLRLHKQEGPTDAERSRPAQSFTTSGDTIELTCGFMLPSGIGDTPTPL